MLDDSEIALIEDYQTEEIAIVGETIASAKLYYPRGMHSSSHIEMKK